MDFARAWMRSRVASGSAGLLRSASETVVLCTPATRAMSVWVTRAFFTVVSWGFSALSKKRGGTRGVDRDELVRAKLTLHDRTLSDSRQTRRGDTTPMS